MAKRQQEEFIPDSIFDALDPQSEDRAKGRKDKTQEVNIGDLMRQLGELKGKVEAYEARPAYIPQPAPAPVTLPDPPKLNLQGLPDPLLNKEEYAAEVARRTLDFQNAQRSHQEAVQKANTPKPLGDPDALWNEFVDKYPEYAADDSRIRFAISEATKKLSARGIDVGKYLFTNTDAAFTQFRTEYDQIFGTPIQEEDENEGEPEELVPEPAPRRAKRLAQDEDDDGRTEGIMSGTERTPPSQVQRLPAGDLIRDLQDMQRKSGYF